MNPSDSEYTHDTEAQALVDELNRCMAAAVECGPTPEYWRRRFRILKHERLEAIEAIKASKQLEYDLRQELDRVRASLDHVSRELEHTRRERDWHSAASAKLWTDVQREHETALRWWSEFDTASKSVVQLQDELVRAKAELDDWQARCFAADTAVREIRSSKLYQLASYCGRLHRAARRILRNPFTMFRLLSR